MKYLKYSGQNLINLYQNSVLSSINECNYNLMCVQTRSSEARWNSNLMKSEHKCLPDGGVEVHITDTEMIKLSKTKVKTH